ncbi:MAG: phosphotransferase [Lachnospiraceae bacterium]|jgi:RIO-like serine/threonine protein kinase|nr:phosphotransferase [Lachnospiraceae bacterium]
MKLQKVVATRSNKTIYRDGDKCIKVFNEGYNKADILNEALNQARVEETGLLIPKVLEVTMIENKWAIVSEYIEGKTLQAMMDENPKKLDEYLDRFVSIQLDMHSRTCKKLSLLKDKMQLKISASKLDATTRYELHTRLEGMHAHMKLCHGDFNPSNIIITKNDDAYIIDWAHATQGNASADAARTYLLFCLADKEDIAGKYLDLFCKKSDTARQYVQKWMPIVAASQSVKGNEKEREFLLRWANVVDYE